MKGRNYKLPPIVKAPPMDAVEREEAKDVTFKLITTGNKYYEHEIVVTAAFSVNDEKVFLKYILPKTPSEETIVNKADRMLGPQIKRVGSQYHMFIKGVMKPTVSLKEAMSSFVAFLKEIAGNGKLNLVGVQCTNHDAYFLNEALTNTGTLADFKSVVGFYTDTDPLFKEAWPTLSQDQIGYQYLIENILEQTYHEFNYVEEVKALGSSVEIARGSYLYVKAGCFKYLFVKDFINYTKRKNELKNTFKPLYRNIEPEPVVISKVLAKKMAKTGISFDHLKEAYQHGQRQGLCLLLTQTVNGQPRVTKEEKTLDKLCDFFAK